jgi:hypothetical protein
MCGKFTSGCPGITAEITGELLRKNYMVSNSCQLSSSIHTSEETEPITIFLALPFWTNATLILQSRRALDVHFYPFLFLFYFIFERNGKRFAVNFIRRKICLCSVKGSSHPSPPPWWRNVTFTSVVEIVYPFLIKKKIEIACDGYSLQEKRCLTLLGASNCFRVNPFQIKIASESIPVSW